MPIIRVQSNETLMKQWRDELDELRRKSARLVDEKSQLTLLNAQLENKVSKQQHNAHFASKKSELINHL